MNLILIPYFEHVGLALAISIGATFNAAMLFLAIKKMNDFKIESTTFIFLMKVILILKECWKFYVNRIKHNTTKILYV